MCLDFFSFIAFLESTDYESAVRLAVSLGGDADTMGAITGGIEEAYYGGVPEHIRKEVLKRLPNEEFYTSIENLIYKGNEYWKIDGDKYIFQKEKINVEIKKNKLGIYIDMSEFLFIWE